MFTYFTTSSATPRRTLKTVTLKQVLNTSSSKLALASLLHALGFTADFTQHNTAADP